MANPYDQFVEQDQGNPYSQFIDNTNLPDTQPAITPQATPIQAAQEAQAANLPPQVSGWGQQKQPRIIRQVPVTWGGRPIGAVVVQDTPPMRQLMENIPVDAYRYFKGLVQAAIHPKASADAIGEMLAGGIEKLIPGYQLDEEKWDIFTQEMGRRYGSMDALKRSLIEQPVQTVADVASVLYPAGKMIQGAGTATKMGRLARIGGKIADVGTMVEPGYAGWMAASKAMEALAPRFYTSAAKFSRVLDAQRSRDLARIALENNIMPTIRGVQEVAAKEKGFRNKIQNMIAEYEAGNRVNIYLDDLLRGTKELETEASLTGDQGQVAGVVRKIRRGNEGRISTGSGRTVLTPGEVQKLKQNLYKQTESYYGKTKTPPFAAEAKMLIAKNAKEMLEHLLPEIKQLNADDSAMIRLYEAITKSANRLNNRDFIGLGAASKALGGGAIGGQAGLGVGVGLAVLDTPGVKARLAVVLHKLGKQGVRISKQSSLFRMALYQSNRQVEREQDYAQTGMVIIPAQPIRQVGNITDEDLQRLFGNQ